MTETEGKSLIQAYFPDFSANQIEQLAHYGALLKDFNQRINLISRKNVDKIWSEHILHSLSIAKVVSFKNGHRILDFGTGGGLPGIPLAIAYPDASFLLIDAIGKKVNAVQTMASEIGLDHVSTRHARVETLNEKFDYAVSRAVTALPTVNIWLRGKIKKGNLNEGVPNGLLYIKGGDFQHELQEIKRPYRTWELVDYFAEPFFETKKVVWIDMT